MSYDLTIVRGLLRDQQYAQLSDLIKAADNQSAALLPSLADADHSPQRDEIIALYALIHAHLGDREQANRLCDDMAENRARLAVDASSDAAAACLTLGRLDDARVFLTHALTQDPSHAFSHARMGLWHELHAVADEDPEEARKRALACYDHAFFLTPDQYGIAVKLAETARDLGQWDKAEIARDTAQRLLQDDKARLDAATASFRENFLQILAIDLIVRQEQFHEGQVFLDAQEVNLVLKDFVNLVNRYTHMLSTGGQYERAELLLQDYIKKYPEQALLYAALADLLASLGREKHAHQVLRVGVKQLSEFVPLWTKIADLIAGQGNSLARQAAERALEICESLDIDSEKEDAFGNVFHPAVVKLDALLALADIEGHDGHYERSMELLDQILSERPDYVPALSQKGRLQMQLGQIDASIDIFERLSILAPSAGISGLIAVNQLPDNVAILDKLEKALKRPAMAGQKAPLLFSLAKAWEKRKDYDRAMTLAHQANEAERAALSYDGKEHRQRCARIRFAFNKDFFDHRQTCGHDSSLPVFVVGMPRSGTTLVEQILAGHPEIHGAGELGNISKIVQQINVFEHYVGSGRAYPDCVDDITPVQSRNYAERILTDLRDHDDKARFVVDKLPHNFQHIGLIKFLFPNAKIISVRRDPRDIAMSNYFTNYQAKHGGMGFAYDLDWIGEQLADHNMLMHHWHQVFPGEILEVQYEDVVQDVEGQARRMLDYIGVDWDPDVLNFDSLDRPVKTASVWQVRQPIYTSSKAKWKNYKNHLARLTQATNRPIEADPITMITLPEPGYLTAAIDHFQKGDLDSAEHCLQTMLHYNPDHAACRNLLGIIFAHKGYMDDGIALVEKALQDMPWHNGIRHNLVLLYRYLGDHARAQQVANDRPTEPQNQDLYPLISLADIDEQKPVDKTTETIPEKGQAS